MFPLAAQRHGIQSIWASEIEKAPVSITKRHFPSMKHLGDITKIEGVDLPPTDIITSGSPCQNLSNIGNRTGLKEEKSSLFFEAIRIIREMRDQTHGTYPTLAILENVLGAFSSNDRLDFKAVLEAFTETCASNACFWILGQCWDWCEGEKLICAGDSSTVNIGESPNEENASFSGQILETSVRTKYFLTPNEVQPDPETGPKSRRTPTQEHLSAFAETR